jgi:hypothetical protein
MQATYPDHLVLLYSFTLIILHNFNYSIYVPKMIRKYRHVYGWLKTGFGLIIGFINYLQIVTAINYYTIADLHTLVLSW